MTALLATSVVNAQVKVKNDLITKQDKKEEDSREKQRKDTRKKQEKKARELWKKVSDAEKEQSPWTKWYHKKVLPGLLELSKVRKNLYKYNLYDPYINRNLKQIDCSKHIDHRTATGECNDLEDSSMGAVWTRFGRNTDPKINYKRKYDVLYPNPRKISLELLERDKFKPVPFLNLLAVAWIQYMTHDWFSHADNEDPQKVKPFVLPVDKKDPMSTKASIV